MSLRTLGLLLILAISPKPWLNASESMNDLDSFVRESCVHCHDESTETSLDFTSLGRDLGKDQDFQVWVKVFDRLQRREMPPASEALPSEPERLVALSLLEEKLKQASQLSQQEAGRVPSRRLTRTEYEYVLHDLLGVGADLSKNLPPENESGSFDVVAENQGMSSVHVRSFLLTADLALDEAIQLGTKPHMAPRELDYFNSPYIEMWVDRPVRNGGGTIFKTDKDVVMFRGENYVFRSNASGFVPPVAGRYRITVKAAAHQQRSSISLSLKLQNDLQGNSELFAAWDLSGKDYREVETTKYLRSDDYIYVSADELDPAPDGSVIYNAARASDFGGEGVKLNRVTIEGPLESNWPPERTRRLFPGIEWAPNGKRTRLGRAYEPIFSKTKTEHAREIVSTFASRAFRRKVNDQEIERWASLAKPGLRANGDFVDSVRLSLRAILISPELLFQTGSTGRLNDHAIARRLAQFLWRSVPDDQLASQGKLTDPTTLAMQVDRMLDDPKCERFIDDFVGQWLELDRIDATTPDAYLYPEYDDVLRRAMLAETRDFLSHLIDEDLSAENLIDSNFTFLNRRLAEHYQIDGIEGEAMRWVELPPDSVRGGILSHASIAKVTANGTVTTPVKRGNFVLTNLLGLPPSPPPPGVGSIEPDTRGATTIRETLEKHQSVDACAVCHRRIDPPGFALECFDPVGNHRVRYRDSKGVARTSPPGLRFAHLDYQLGLAVETAGTTEDGFVFEGIHDYKSHLRQSIDQVARNLVSKLIVFSTGGEIEFADREEVERILRSTKDDGYPLRKLIHQVVASRTFLTR